MTAALDEELWFGSDRAADAEAEQRAASSLAAMVGRVLGAKPFPEATRKLAELTRNPACRMDAVVRVLEADPALSARLLRLVNSAGYALRVRCTSVRHAAALVGVMRLNQMATTAAVLELFDSSSESATRVLDHSKLVGALCRYLAVHLGLPPDDMFTCGFLHDIGKLMLLEANSAAYVDLLQHYGDEPDAMHLHEREIYGFDHAVLGAHVLAAWNIPDPVPKVVAWHHQVQRAYEASTIIASMVNTLRMADEIAYVLGKYTQSEGVERIARSNAASYLDISEAQLAAMWPELETLREACFSRPSNDKNSILEFVSVRPSADTATMVSNPAPSLAPKHFACVVCSKPGFAQTCPACHGHVCPEHQVGRDQWCSNCVNDFDEQTNGGRAGWNVKAAAGSAAVVLFGAAAFSASQNEALELPQMIGASTLLALVFVMFVVVGYRWYQRASFLRARPNLESGVSSSAVESAPEVDLGTSIAPQPSLRPVHISVNSPTIPATPGELRRADAIARASMPRIEVSDGDSSVLPIVFSQPPARVVSERPQPSTERAHATHERMQMVSERPRPATQRPAPSEHQALVSERPRPANFPESEHQPAARSEVREVQSFTPDLREAVTARPIAPGPSVTIAPEYAKTLLQSAIPGRVEIGEPPQNELTQRIAAQQSGMESLETLAVAIAERVAQSVAERVATSVAERMVASLVPEAPAPTSVSPAAPSTTVEAPKAAKKPRAKRTPGTPKKPRAAAPKRTRAPKRKAPTSIPPSSTSE